MTVARDPARHPLPVLCVDRSCPVIVVTASPDTEWGGQFADGERVFEVTTPDGRTERYSARAHVLAVGKPR